MVTQEVEREKDELGKLWTDVEGDVDMESEVCSTTSSSQDSDS